MSGLPEDHIYGRKMPEEPWGVRGSTIFVWNSIKTTIFEIFFIFEKVWKFPKLTIVIHSYDYTVPEDADKMGITYKGYNRFKIGHTNMSNVTSPNSKIFN